ncbi:hypothetical protein HDU96_001173 [Phlyctochytrium bullatum]|nr:hypothetical protein HDU96_001173 [Phlyctochytrium bullatum]
MGKLLKYPGRTNNLKGTGPHEIIKGELAERKKFSKAHSMPSTSTPRNVLSEDERLAREIAQNQIKNRQIEEDDRRFAQRLLEEERSGSSRGPVYAPPQGSLEEDDRRFAQRLLEEEQRNGSSSGPVYAPPPGPPPPMGVYSTPAGTPPVAVYSPPSHPPPPAAPPAQPTYQPPPTTYQPPPHPPPANAYAPPPNPPPPAAPSNPRAPSPLISVEEDEPPRPPPPAPVTNPFLVPTGTYLPPNAVVAPGTYAPPPIPPMPVEPPSPARVQPAAASAAPPAARGGNVAELAGLSAPGSDLNPFRAASPDALSPFNPFRQPSPTRSPSPAAASIGNPFADLLPPENAAGAQGTPAAAAAPPVVPIDPFAGALGGGVAGETRRGSTGNARQATSPGAEFDPLFQAGGTPAASKGVTGSAVDLLASNVAFSPSTSGGLGLAGPSVAAFAPSTSPGLGLAGSSAVAFAPPLASPNQPGYATVAPPSSGPPVSDPVAEALSMDLAARIALEEKGGALGFSSEEVRRQEEESQSLAEAARLALLTAAEIEDEMLTKQLQEMEDAEFAKSLAENGESGPASRTVSPRTSVVARSPHEESDEEVARRIQQELEDEEVARRLAEEEQRHTPTPPASASTYSRPQSASSSSTANFAPVVLQQTPLAPMPTPLTNSRKTGGLKSRFFGPVTRSATTTAVTRNTATGSSSAQASTSSSARTPGQTTLIYSSAPTSANLPPGAIVVPNIQSIPAGYVYAGPANNRSGTSSAAATTPAASAEDAAPPPYTR